ncbi:MAG: 23S rRNA (guanosine(2251)-2'-O)-methyltransferase RlmB [Bacilli bacterium]|nr:23S rRNA (guanosine(2251)-2'-O)-methyltransferase RlmB [Bacilli bacterium]
MLIYGRNSCYEYLKKYKKVKTLYLDEDFGDKKLISLIDSLKIKPSFCKKFQLDELAKENHQGIIMDVGDYEYCDLDDIIKENGTIVILDHLEDTHNFGAIIRTCVAAGVDGIIIPKDRSVSVNSTVMKTSVGSAINMNICMVTNLNQTINYLKDKGYWIYASDMNGECFTDVNYSGNVALVIGNEGKGISELVKKSSDYIVSIPMSEKQESLNASVAAGILIYEIRRQKNL